MTTTFAEIREILLEKFREYLSTEENRRDAKSALTSFVSFWIFLYIASHGVMPSYLQIDRPGRAIAVKFVPTEETRMAELAQTRLQQAQEAPKSTLPPPPVSERPPVLESLSSMAAARPDYFGKHAILPPKKQERPVVSDAPARWQENPAPQEAKSERPIYGSASVSMPSPKIGAATGKAESTSDVTFDVQVSSGSQGSDFITLTSRNLPSSVGRPGGKEMSVRRPILKSPLPTVPEWFERKGLDSFVTLRIIISANGRVELAEVEKTSGFKEIDADARDAILQWVFEPTGFRESIAIKLNYRLR